LLLNSEVLDFKFDSTAGCWTASCSKPLIVENRALGYRAEHHILTFTWADRIIRERLHSVYTPLAPRDAGERKQWLSNRKWAYWGSLKHFLWAFAREKLKEEAFEIVSTDLVQNGGVLKPVQSRAYPTTQLYANAEDPSTGLRILRLDRWLGIRCGSNAGYLRLGGAPALVDTLGNIRNSIEYEIAGGWADTRLADSLPWDYTPPR
jgi:hypothetical protein